MLPPASLDPVEPPAVAMFSRAALRRPASSIARQGRISTTRTYHDEDGSLFDPGHDGVFLLSQ